MDYEKAYNEALERAKNYHDNNFSFGTTQLTEAIFPELKESEDERIRKYIVKFVELEKGGGNLPPDDADKMLAYLERQKEQKPAEWSEEDEDTIEKAICVLEANFEPNEEFIGLDIKRSQLVDRLKSLRPQPHWKPSEKQMEALYILGQCVVSPELRTLFFDLKKLM